MQFVAIAANDRIPPAGSVDLEPACQREAFILRTLDVG